MSGDTEDLITACRKLVAHLKRSYGDDEGMAIWSKMAEALPSNVQQEITMTSLREPPVRVGLSPQDILERIRARTNQQKQQQITNAQKEYEMKMQMRAKLKANLGG